MKIKVIGLLCIFAVAQTLYASSILQINTIQLVNDAVLVFEGEVVATRSEHIPAGAIVTYVDFQLLDVIKGNVDAGVILTLRFTGGTVGDLKMDVGSVIPKQGEHGIYFVETFSRYLTNPLLGWSQGHFRIQKDGSLLTGNNQRVTQLSMEQSRAAKLSHGAAKGIITGYNKRGDESALSDKAVTVESFKQFIKSLNQSK